MWYFSIRQKSWSVLLQQTCIHASLVLGAVNLNAIRRYLFGISFLSCPFDERGCVVLDKTSRRVHDVVEVIIWLFHGVVADVTSGFSGEYDPFRTRTR